MDDVEKYNDRTGVPSIRNVFSLLSTFVCPKLLPYPLVPSLKYRHPRDVNDLGMLSSFLVVRRGVSRRLPTYSLSGTDEVS